MPSKIAKDASAQEQETWMGECIRMMRKEGKDNPDKVCYAMMKSMMGQTKKDKSS